MALPPVSKSVVVPLPPGAAFDLFVRRIADWWPLKTRSASGRAVTCAVEGRVGGRIYETTAEGEEFVWGEILVWEEPARLVFTWRVPGLPDAAATEVEVRFSSAAESTRVELEHRQWERLGALAATLRGTYDGGWPAILVRFESLAAGKPMPGPPTESGCRDVVEASIPPRTPPNTD
jgi:uncharacterized protein YndB with AHSA1/START domain